MPPQQPMPPQPVMPSPAMPSVMPPPRPAMPASMPPMEPAGGIPSVHLPEWEPQSKPNMGDAAVQGQKKELLQKLMGNLLGKPGRSFHELTNGIKQALSAYKSFSNELDLLHGGGQQTPSSGGSPTGGSSGGIQDILKSIQAKKAAAPVDGGGGPGFGQIPQTVQMGHTPQQTPLPPQQPIAGQSQTSSFNRPAPVSTLGIWGF